MESSIETEISMIFLILFAIERSFATTSFIIFYFSRKANEMFANPSFAHPNAITTSFSSSSPNTSAPTLSKKQQTK